MQPKKSLVALSLFFVVAGTLLTLENFGIVHGITRLWPIFISVLGVGFVLLYTARAKKDLALIWLGTFFCSLSLFFFYCTYSSWGKMAHLWPVFFGIIGVCFCSIWIVSRKALYAGLCLSFFLLFFVFYLIFSVSLMLWPVSLVIFGISLLIINYANKKECS